MITSNHLSEAQDNNFPKGDSMNQALKVTTTGGTSCDAKFCRGIYEAISSSFFKRNFVFIFSSLPISSPFRMVQQRRWALVTSPSVFLLPTPPGANSIRIRGDETSPRVTADHVRICASPYPCPRERRR